MGNNSTKTNERKPRITIKDVASAANVSIATVSYVLNNKPGQSISEDTRKKVLQFANLLGYECNVMARYLATGKSNTVAVVIKNVDGIGAQYYLKLITELTRLFGEYNRALRVCEYSDELDHASNACDAYITLALSAKEFRAFADTKYVPVVAVDSVFEDFLFYRINDDYKALYATAKHDLNADKIQLLTFPLPDDNLQTARNEFDGVTVIRSLRDIPQKSDGTRYATQCRTIADNIDLPIYCADKSFALKAAAAVEAVNQALDRIVTSHEDHDIKV